MSDPKTDYNTGRGFRQRMATRRAELTSDERKAKKGQRPGMGYDRWWERQTGPGGQLFSGIGTNYDWRNFTPVGLTGPRMGTREKAKKGQPGEQPSEKPTLGEGSEPGTIVETSLLKKPRMPRPGATTEPVPGTPAPAKPVREPWTPGGEPWGPSGPAQPVAPPSGTWVGGAQFAREPEDPAGLPWGPSGPVFPTQVKRTFTGLGGGNWPSADNSDAWQSWTKMSGP